MGQDEEKSLKILYNCNTLLDLVLFIFLRALVLIFRGVVLKRYLISFCFRRNLIQLSCMCSEIDVHLFCSKIFI